MTPAGFDGGIERSAQRVVVGPQRGDLARYELMPLLFTALNERRNAFDRYREPFSCADYGAQRLER